MQHLQEKLQLKECHLRNVTITGLNFKNLPMYEPSGKALEGMFKTYKDALPEDGYLVGESTFNDILNMLKMSGESKSGLSTYYI